MDIGLLEQAAACIQNADTGPEGRKKAEQIFTELESGQYPIDALLDAINRSRDQFVLQRLAQATATVVLKLWLVLNPNVIQATNRQLLDFAAANQNLSSFVLNSFTQAVAISIKRGILDDKAGTREEVCRMIDDMVKNNNIHIQNVGCRLILAMTEEFSCAWRSSHLGITFDFHTRAKSDFERIMLKSIFEMVMEIFDILCNQPDPVNTPYQKLLFSRLLDICDNIFSWDFQSRAFRALSASANFRPPSSWANVMTPQLIDLLFRVHVTVRNDAELATKSISCLSYLGGVAGETMKVPNVATGFLERFVHCLLDTFGSGPLEHEISGLCSTINRIFTLRPVSQIMRIPEQDRGRLLGFYVQFMDHLMRQAIAKFITEDDDDCKQDLVHLFSGWGVLLKGRWRGGLNYDAAEEIDNNFIYVPTQQLVNTFIQCLQSPPFGFCPEPPEVEENADNDYTDDRARFFDILIGFGDMAVYTCSSFIPSASQLINHKVEQLKMMVSVPIDEKDMNRWREDMHWLMLIVAHSVIVKTDGDFGKLAPLVKEVSEEQAEDRDEPYTDENKNKYVRECVSNPMGPHTVSTDHVDPFIVLFGEVLTWNVLEFEMMKNPNIEVSPELCRSSLLALSRFIGGVTNLADTVCNPDLVPMLYPNEETDSALVNFVFEKVLYIFTHMGGESRLCNDAVDLLEVVIDARATFLSQTDHLLEFFSQCDILSLPCRAGVMRALILVASQMSQEIQNTMYNTLLTPLTQRLVALASQPPDSITDTLIDDLLQCFTGVAQAGQTDASCSLTGYWFSLFIDQILTVIVPLMNSHSHCQPIITSILQFMHDTTTKVISYIPDLQIKNNINDAVVLIIRSYALNQPSRQNVSSEKEDEEKAGDVVLFLKILSNIINKDLSDFNDTNDLPPNVQAAVACVESLIGIMNESLLAIPEVAINYYGIIESIFEFSRNTVTLISDHLLDTFFACIECALDSRFGTDILCRALEALCEIGLYFANNQDTRRDVAHDRIHKLMPVAFDVCLSYSGDDTILGHASSGLFACIAYDRAFFEQYVVQVVSHPVNDASRNHLQTAFNELLPAVIRHNRHGRLDFRRRLENLFEAVQGLLHIPF